MLSWLPGGGQFVFPVLGVVACYSVGSVRSCLEEFVVVMV